MKIVDIQSNNSKSLILFFCGWGYDEACIAHLKTKKYDVKALYDYRHLEPESPMQLANYTHITVVAWSYGVWVANKVLGNAEQSIDQSLAINGTLKPVDDNYGIPVDIFNATLNSLTERSYQKFQVRVMGGSTNYSNNKGYLPARNFTDQKEELECLAEMFAIEPKVNLKWDKAICGSSDFIIGFDNQIRFWGDKSIIKSYPHFIFDHYQTWDDLLNDFNHA